MQSSRALSELRQLCGTESILLVVCRVSRIRNEYTKFLYLYLSSILISFLLLGNIDYFSFSVAGVMIGRGWSNLLGRFFAG
jgi:hypothetical protein